MDEMREWMLRWMNSKALKNENWNKGVNRFNVGIRELNDYMVKSLNKSLWNELVEWVTK